MARGGAALVIALAMGAAIAACEPQATLVPEAPSSVASVDQAIRAFGDICLDTAPGFADARARFARNGLTERRDDGIIYDGTGSLSVRVDRVETSKGRMMRCSVVYEDPNRFIARERIDDMVAGVGRAVGQQRTAQFPTVQGGLRQGRVWVYSSGDRTGELIDVPHVGDGNLGVLILQFRLA